MLSEQEYLILSFYDKDIPKRFDDKAITDEMILAGIQKTSARGFGMYWNIITELLTWEYIGRKWVQGGGVTRAINSEEYVLKELGEKALRQYETAQREEYERNETQKLTEELQIKNLQLQNEVLALQKDKEHLEKANYNLEQKRKESADKLVELQRKELKNKILYTVIAFVAGLIATNAKDILSFLKQSIHE